MPHARRLVTAEQANIGILVKVPDSVIFVACIYDKSVIIDSQYDIKIVGNSPGGAGVFSLSSLKFFLDSGILFRFKDS
jgi:hypothetical protein